jgi:hypothetical protein
MLRYFIAGNGWLVIATTLLVLDNQLRPHAEQVYSFMAFLAVILAVIFFILYKTTRTPQHPGGE